MENEAYFYEEMESLQGIVIPRYYGFYKGEIPLGYNLVGEDTAYSSRDQTEHDNDSRRNFEATRHVSILLIEKLGGKLPVGKPLPPNIEYVHLCG